MFEASNSDVTGLLPARASSLSQYGFRLILGRRVTTSCSRLLCYRGPRPPRIRLAGTLLAHHRDHVYVSVSSLCKPSSIIYVPVCHFHRYSIRIVVRLMLMLSYNCTHLSVEYTRLPRKYPKCFYSKTLQNTVIRSPLGSICVKRSKTAFHRISLKYCLGFKCYIFKTISTAYLSKSYAFINNCKMHIKL